MRKLSIREILVMTSGYVRPNTLCKGWGGGGEGNKVSARREEYVIFTWREIEQEMAWPLSSLSKLYYMLLLLLLL